MAKPLKVEQAKQRVRVAADDLREHMIQNAGHSRGFWMATGVGMGLLVAISPKTAWKLTKGVGKLILGAR